MLEHEAITEVLVCSPVRGTHLGFAALGGGLEALGALRDGLQGQTRRALSQPRQEDAGPKDGLSNGLLGGSEQWLTRGLDGHEVGITGLVQVCKT